MALRKILRKINSIDFSLKNTIFIKVKSHSRRNFESASIQQDFSASFTKYQPDLKSET